MATEIYDVIIIGGGPAGYTAAIYCGRAAMKTLLLEKYMPGGQMGITAHIDNYPGFPEGIDGFTLAMDMEKQAERFQIEHKTESKFCSIRPKDKSGCFNGTVYSAKSVIIASGASARELGLPEERELRGKGVSYCATCDGAFFRNKTVAVIGGGDTAAADAVFLSKLCKQVYVVHRRDTLRAAAVYYDVLKQTENVTFVWDSTVEEILHDNTVTGIRIKNKHTGQLQTIDCQGVFVAIGNVPNTKLYEKQIELDGNGYVIAEENTKTSQLGVFVAGDIRTKPLRQVVTAVADGAVAAYMAEEYIQLQTAETE
ncbi:MAG: thioredoxin-disulfide reductase [Acutalibacteraceae bacterium]